MDKDTQERLSNLLIDRRKKIALLDLFRMGHLAYLATEEQLNETEEAITQEVKDSLVNPNAIQTLQKEKNEAGDSKPSIFGIFAAPDGTSVELLVGLEKEKQIRAGENEIRLLLIEKNQLAVVAAIESAALEIKNKKEEEAKDKRGLVFCTKIEDNNPLPQVTEADANLKGLTKIKQNFYAASELLTLPGLQVKFDYRAEGEGPKNVKRAKGKDGLQATMVEGFVMPGGAFMSRDGDFCLRVRNRNYRSTSDAPSQMPGNKYVRQEGDFPPVTYRVDRIVLNTFQKCVGGVWMPVSANV